MPPSSLQPLSFLLWVSFCWWGNWDSKKISPLPKITQPDLALLRLAPSQSGFTLRILDTQHLRILDFFKGSYLSSFLGIPLLALGKGALGTQKENNSFIHSFDKYLLTSYALPSPFSILFFSVAFTPSVYFTSYEFIIFPNWNVIQGGAKMWYSPPV